MRHLALITLCVLLNVPASAQTVRTILEIPVNFRNDTRQPRSLAQLKANGENGPARVLAENSNALPVPVTATVTVLNYLTLDMDKGCSSGGAQLPALNMPDFYAKVDAGLTARGESRFGYTYVWIVSPTTLGYCGETDRMGLSFQDELHTGNMLARFAWSLGLRLAINWTCRTPTGAFTTFSPVCGPSSLTANGRTFTSISGQGQGAFGAYERHQLGFLPAAQQATVTSTTGQWTLTRLENPASGLKRLLIPEMGIELEYHAPKTSVDWDSRGVTGHAINTSRRLDFTPDDFVRGRSTALEPGASWVYQKPATSGGFGLPAASPAGPLLRLTVLSADMNTAVVDLRPASDPLPAIPVGPRCATTSPDTSVNVTALVDGTCGVWKVDTTTHRVFRTPGGYFGSADSITFCHGVVYVPITGAGWTWNRYPAGAVGEVLVPMDTPAAPDCVAGVPTPPPPVIPPPPPPSGTFAIAIADPAPASARVGVTSTTGITTVVTVTGKPIAYVEASFGLVGGSPTVFRCGAPATAYSSCGQSGSDYTFTFRTGYGPGTRTLTVTAKATDGEATKATQTVAVTP